MTWELEDAPKVVLGLDAVERQLSVEKYFARFLWWPRLPDPRSMTPEQFFLALDEVPSSRKL